MKALSPTIRIVRLDDALNENGEPRGGLVIPPCAGTNRPTLALFDTIRDALMAKARMEGQRHVGR